MRFDWIKFLWSYVLRYDLFTEKTIISHYMMNFYATESLCVLPIQHKHKPIYLVGLLTGSKSWCIISVSKSAGLPRIFQYTDLSSHWPFPVKVYTNPTSLWTIGFMLWKTPTSLWVGRLTKCANPTSQWHFGSIVLVLFFVVWIVVTVSVRGDSPTINQEKLSLNMCVKLFPTRFKTGSRSHGALAWSTSWRLEFSLFICIW